jgi:membrane-associated phospholipid phosphatase
MTVRPGLTSVLAGGVVRQGRRSALVCAVLVVAVYASSLGYEPLNHGPNRIFLRTRLDEQIPLVPAFAIPYLSLIAAVYLSLVAFLLMRVRVFESAAVAVALAFGLSYIVFAVAQSYVARPVDADSGGLHDLVRRIYAGDQPYNDFPSLHVALSTVLAIHWLRLDRRAGMIASTWLALIAVSTLFVHQHYLADVVGGVILALATSALGRVVADRLHSWSLQSAR